MKIRKRIVVFLILIAFGNLIAAQNQYVICKESSGKIAIESYSSKCCNKNDFFYCKNLQDSRLKFSSSRQTDTCIDTQLEISVFSKQDLAEDNINYSSSFIIDDKFSELNSYQENHPQKTDRTCTQNQSCISTIVLLI